MVQMPTGTGKTHVLAHVVNRELGMAGDFLCSRSILIVAHRMELIAQIGETLQKLGIRRDGVNVESIQTVSRRLGTLELTPDLVVIDEAHHALAKTYRILWEKWPEARFLGLTATPCRMNRSGFTDLFDALVSSWSIAEFIRKGVLSAFDYVSIRPDSKEQQLVDSLEKRGADGDYQVKEMDALLNRRPSIERLYGSMMRFACGKKGIVYAISIGHARKIAEYYTSQGVVAEAIDSLTPLWERKRLVDEFRKGVVKVLVNVDVFSEGFDCPDVEFVQLARPTLSLSKYLQQVGRGLRRTEGKDSCMLIDNVGLYRLFGLPVASWNWEGMFRGEIPGKVQHVIGRFNEWMCPVLWQAEMPGQDIGMGLVISHEMLLSRLNEPDIVRPLSVDKVPVLRVWQDPVSGLWGLKRGRTTVTEAIFAGVFDMKDERLAVRLDADTCGLVDADGKVIWKKGNYLSMKFISGHFLVMEDKGHKLHYMDLYNFHLYDDRPEIRRFGCFELLKVKGVCYSRTKEIYTSTQSFRSLRFSDRDFFLAIIEYGARYACMLKGDYDRIYRIRRWLDDGGIVVADSRGNFYHVEQGKGKTYIGCTLADMDRLAGRVEKEMEGRRNGDRQKVLFGYDNAVPFRVGMKWGLKVGNRITVPPVYRNVRCPIGRFCAVEKNYNQWGVIDISGTVLVEPKYPEVSIGDDGTALLTQITGKKMMVKLL